MRILYLGDIMGRVGRNVIKELLPGIKAEYQVDFVVAQGENLSAGKGMKIKHMRDMQAVGVDFFTGGNHTWNDPEIYPLLEDPNEPVIGPANYPDETPGKGFKLIDTPFGKILVISLLGNTVPSTPQVSNPLKKVEEILNEYKNVARAATIVNFHGDYSSEKLVVGHYLDGRATLVVGDHWHIPTADAQVLPGGTAHITDVGMCGSLDSSLGVKTDVIIKRWLTQLPNKNELEMGGRRQLCGVVVDVDNDGKATNIEQIRRVLDPA
jgi:metallophosphoesterase (TIGR00282 family)